MGSELLPGNEVFRSIFCSMVGKELQELQNGERASAWQ
jgi:hypothetical protein